MITLFFTPKDKIHYNEESNTNLNSFTNETFYLLNVSAGLGRRVVDIVEPDMMKTILLMNIKIINFMKLIIII